ncbi:unnamed protein product [Angiostrongylus costaricensis]|uniref:Uncharacterized protein n=1 Tax=Angiostrongylus costaricensis TaxID=334426 RepID=A0A0R3PZU1_ANGCS|nr:unnamed protein product [Angiostrongylus costaricensis]
MATINGLSFPEDRDGISSAAGYSAAQMENSVNHFRRSAWIALLRYWRQVDVGPSSIVVSTPRCGRGDTGSIPVLGILLWWMEMKGTEKACHDNHTFCSEMLKTAMFSGYKVLNYWQKYCNGS